MDMKKLAAIFALSVLVILAIALPTAACFGGCGFGGWGGLGWGGLGCGGCGLGWGGWW